MKRRLFLAGLLTLVALVALIESPLGKRGLARLAERASARVLNGTVRIGSLRGNLWRKLTLSQVELRDAKGGLVAAVANIGLEWRLAFPRWNKPRLLISRLALEQPRLYPADLAALLPAGKPPEKAPTKTSAPAFLWLQRLSVIEGRFENITPINVNLLLPDGLASLPTGQIFAGGRWRGLRLHVAARASSVSEQPLPEHSLGLVASLGRSKVALSARGYFDVTDPRQSAAKVTLGEFHAVARELSPRWPALPGSDFLAKGFLDWRQAGFKTGFELHVQGRGRFLLEGHGSDTPHQRRLIVDRARLEGRCPLLTLEHPAALDFSEGAAPRGRLELAGCAGRVSYEHTATRLRASVTGLQLSRLLEALSLDAATGEEPRFTGVVTIALDLPHGATVPPAHVAAQVLGLSAAGLGAKFDANADADYDGAHAALNGAIALQGSDSPESKLELRLRANVLPNQPLTAYPLDWSASLRSFDLARFLAPATFHGLEPPHVRATLAASGTGTLANPAAAAELALATTQGHVATLHASLVGRHLEGELKAQGADLDPVVAILTDAFQLRGSRIDADFHLSAELARASGPGLAPRCTGTIRLAAEQLAVPSIGTTYEKIALRLKGDTSRIQLESLEVGDGSDGALSATGRLEADELRLHAELKDFQALANAQLAARANGTLELAANRRDSSFSGRLAIRGARLTIPDLLGQSKSTEPLGALEDFRTNAGARSRGPLDGWHGRIQVDAPAGVLLVSADKSLDIELKADLQAGLEPDAEGAPSAVVTGTVKTIRGDAEILGRRFELQPSQLTFRSDPANPLLEVAAIYHAPSYGILVSLDGELEHLKPRFSSDPAGLSEDQSLAVLLTGSPDFNRGGPGPSAEKQAANVASGFLLGQLKTKVGSSLPIDSLNADLGSEDSASAQTQTQTAGTDNDGRKKIEVGKYVSDRVFVKLGHTFSAEAQSAIEKVMVNYRVSSRWSLQTSQTDQGQSDLQLLWTLSY